MCFRKAHSVSGPVIGLTAVCLPQGVYALFASEFEIYLCRDDAYSWFSRCALRPIPHVSHAPCAALSCRAGISWRMRRKAVMHGFSA